MYPDNNQTPNSIDYLNQIAPKASNNKLDIVKKNPIFVGAIALVAFLVIVLFAATVSSFFNSINPIERLASRLSSTQDTVKSANYKIRSSKLRALNSSLNIYLTNTIRDSTPIFKNNNVQVDKLDKKVIEAESNKKMLATLEDARLNAIYDRTYAREMAYQLDTVLTLMRQVYKGSKSSSLKNFLDNAYKTLEPTQKQFADYNAANS